MTEGWRGRIAGAVNWSPEAELTYLSSIIDEMDEIGNFSNEEYRRYTLKITALNKLIDVKGKRTGFSPEDLREFLLSIVRIIRKHVRDEETFRRIAQDIYETEVHATKQGGTVRPLTEQAEVFLPTPRRKLTLKL